MTPERLALWRERFADHHSANQRQGDSLVQFAADLLAAYDVQVRENADLAAEARLFYEHPEEHVSQICEAGCGVCDLIAERNAFRAKLLDSNGV